MLQTANKKTVMIDSLELQEVLPNHCQLIMVAEREGVDRLGSKEPARTKRPPPVLPQRGTRGFHDI